MAMLEDTLPGCVDCVSSKPPKARQSGQADAVHADSTSTCSSPQSVGSPLSDISTASSESTVNKHQPRTSQSSKRQGLRQLRQQKLRSFLLEHRFADVSEPRLSTRCCIFHDSIYPIHIAAQIGDADTVHMLLAAGADPNQRTSRGMLAVDLAAAKDEDGSHSEVIELLQGQLKVLGLRDAVELMRGQTQPLGQSGVNGSSPRSSRTARCCQGMRCLNLVM